MELKDGELKDREEKAKAEIEELFQKPIIVAKDDRDKFEGQEMKNIKPIKENWYSWLTIQTIAGEKIPKTIRDKLK